MRPLPPTPTRLSRQQTKIPNNLVTGESGHETQLTAVEAAIIPTIEHALLTMQPRATDGAGSPCAPRLGHATQRRDGPRVFFFIGEPCGASFSDTRGAAAVFFAVTARAGGDA